MDADEGRQRQYTVTSLDRALTLLDVFSRDAIALNASEVAERLDTAVGTIYPTLRTLEHHGYLTRDDQKRYRLGLKFLEKGKIILDQLDVRVVAEAHLKRLAENCRANTHLAVLYENRVMYLHREEGYPSITIRDIVGRSVPAHCTALGKVLLANLNERAQDSFFRTTELTSLTPNTTTNEESLRAELAQTREQGYALDDEEFHEGVVCVAAPVQDYRGAVVAAVSVSLPRSRFMDSQNQDDLIEQVQDTALRISEAQGYQNAV